MGRPRVEPITEAQQQALRAVQRYIEREGYPPTMKELAAVLGISSPSAHARVKQLIRKGFLRREGQKARGLTVGREPVEPGRVPRLVAVPVVGTVRAGRPILAEENILGELLVEEGVTRNRRCFALAVRGDSMIEAGISEGDLVIVAQQETAENGDIVVALLEDEATLKRLYRAPDRIELQAANAAYKTMRVGPDDVLRIAGKVIAVRRQ